MNMSPKERPYSTPRGLCSPLYAHKPSPCSSNCNEWRAVFGARESLRTRALLAGCAKTVSELHLLKPPGLLFERKQIPQIVVIVRIQRKTMEPLEQSTVPWAHVRHSRRGAAVRIRILLAGIYVNIIPLWNYVDRQFKTETYLPLAADLLPCLPQ